MTFNPHRITATADQTPTVPPPYIPVSGPMPPYSGPPSITKGGWHKCFVCDGTGRVQEDFFEGATVIRIVPCRLCDGTGAHWW